MKVYHGSLLKLLEESRNNMFQINQNNVHLLLPGKISWLVEYLHDDYGYTLKESLDHIYHSTLYKKLSTADTHYWQLSPVDLYDELKRERVKLFSINTKPKQKNIERIRKALDTVGKDICNGHLIDRPVTYN